MSPVSQRKSTEDCPREGERHVWVRCGYTTLGPHKQLYTRPSQLKLVNFRTFFKHSFIHSFIQKAEQQREREKTENFQGPKDLGHPH